MVAKFSVYALKVGESSTDYYRKKGIQPLHMSDEERDKPLFYHFWCIKGDKESIIVDTGIDPEHKDGIIDYESPVTLLEQIGVNAKKIEKVIITHLHQNHFSGIYLYQNADFYIQEEDFRSQAKRIAERRFMRERALLPPMLQEDLKDISCMQRVRYVAGEEKIINGVTCHLVGGHTPGMQVVSVETENGIAVICSDLAYLFRNITEETPVGSFWDLHQACEGLHKVKQIASDEKLLFPSHDPLVWDGRFPLVNQRIAKLA